MKTGPSRRNAQGARSSANFKKPPASTHFWRASRRVPDPGNLDELEIVIHPINDPIRSKNDLANDRHAMFWHHPPAFRLLLQHIDVPDQAEGKCQSALWTIAGNIMNNIP